VPMPNESLYFCSAVIVAPVRYNAIYSAERDLLSFGLQLEVA
jgi:hypothetical protein